MPNQIYLIRHGQSTFNAIFDLNHIDPLHFDARLSRIGIEQVKTTRFAASKLGANLVVTSPLTRALETAIGLFDPAETPIVINHLLRERLGNSCDVGRTSSILADEFPMLTFSHLTDPWWHDGEKDMRGVALEPEHLVAQRVEAFSSWLKARPEEVVAVIGHGEFFRRLSGRSLENCEILQWDSHLSRLRDFD